jgi:hypothetical protein
MAGDFISNKVYAEESGDHPLESTDPIFPTFVLTFCIFEKEDNVQVVEPGSNG